MTCAAFYCIPELARLLVVLDIAGSRTRCLLRSLCSLRTDHCTQVVSAASQCEQENVVLNRFSYRRSFSAVRRLWTDGNRSESCGDHSSPVRRTRDAAAAQCGAGTDDELASSVTT